MPNDNFQYPDALIVPSPPDGTLYANHLKWCVFVMNDEDPQRHFAASCLAWCLKSGGLSDRQAKACDKMLSRIRALYDADALDCQQSDEMSEFSVQMHSGGVH